MRIKAAVVAALPGPVRSMVERAEASPLASRMTRGAFWTVMSSGINRALGLAVGIVVARLVGKEPYGQLSVVVSTVGIFSLVAGFGTSLTATKFVAQHRHAEPERAGRIISLATTTAMTSAAIVALTVVAIAPWLSRRVLAAPELTTLVRIGCAQLFFEAWNGAKAGALSGLEAFQAVARVDFVAGLVGVACTVGGVLVAGVEGALIGMVCGQAAHAIGYSLALGKKAEEAGVPLAWRGAAREWRVLLGFSLPALLAAAAAALVNWLCRVIMVNQPDGYAQMGLFHAASQWRTAIVFLPATMSHAFLPILSNMVGNRDERAYHKILRTSLALSFGLALAVAAVVCVASPLIMRTYGRDFADGTLVLIVLAAASVMAATVGMVGQAIVSAGYMWLAFALNATWGVAVLSATWVERTHGAYGFAVANLIAYSVHLVTCWAAYHATTRRLFGRSAAA